MIWPCNIRNRDRNLKQHPEKHEVSIFGKKLCLPRSRLMRQFLGGLFIFGGLLGFLPVLGFWMLPIGLIILSYDSSCIRRIRRKAEVAILRRWHASRFGKKRHAGKKKTKVTIRVT